MHDVDDPLGGLAAPNCERCLVPLVLAGRGLAWRCTECGLARL